MAKDDRLFAKFTLDFADSPKIAPLTDAAFRQYVEAVLWSRRLLTDGKVPQGMVGKLFTDAALTELTGNDAERPSLAPVEGGYLLHDFLDHQTSRAEIEAMREQKREAGRQGGRAKAAAKQKATSDLAPASPSPAERYPDSASTRGSETYPERETETETLTTDVVRKTPTAKAVRKVATDLPEPFIVTRDMRVWADKEVHGLNVDKATESFVDYWRGIAGVKSRKADWVATWRNSLRSTYERGSGSSGSSYTRPPTKPSKGQQLIDVVQLGERMQAEADRKALTA